MTISTPPDAPAAPATAPFGRMLTAMITPMLPDGAVDYDGAARLASYLVDDMRNDGLVISGTTGESPTTTDEEQDRLLRTVIEAVGDRASIVAGVGTNNTAHSQELTRRAQQAGADGLLVVTPYYSKPPQHALEAHFRAVADVAELPVMLYDIPGRTGTPIATETLVRLADHENIVAVKDAKEDVAGTSEVLARTDLVYYCGTDMVNLPWLSLGAVGFVSVVGHVVGDLLHEMIDEFEAGQVGRARELHLALLPVYTGLFRNQGLVMTKAALNLLGLPAGPVRQPLADATAAEIRRLREDLEAGGVKLPGSTA
ncbi:MAG TPA: 4-hydroxy-tetrahydrodipicolinate synthase [Streptosporangiaceae bacterium]|nr:4-hydroxy-tetrahydrodipicolinate synthase [Streptosporangiaceae bacterium]